MKKELDIILKKYGNEAVKVLKRELRVDRTVASGDTLNSIIFKVSNSNVTIQFDSTLGIIDGGNRAGGSAPSSSEILIWMREKNIRPRNTRKGAGSFTRQTERNMRASAFAIARSIAAKGTIKRFGYGGSKVLSRIEQGSKVMRDLDEDISNLLDDKIQLIFKQL